MSDVKDRKDYFAYYYESRKEEISKARKKRYIEDPEYRRQIKERAEKSYVKTRIDRERLKSEGKIKRKEIKPRKNDPVEIIYKGKKTKAFGICVLSDRIGKSKHTINRWIKVGLLPETPIKRGKTGRLYTNSMILAIKIALSKRTKISVNDRLFTDEIIDGWRKIGVYLY